MLTKKRIPLLFLLCISIFWAFFYQSSTIFNDFGDYKPEWLLLIDGLIVLPFLCWLFIPNKKEAVIKAVAFACLVILLGSFIIPQSAKLIWPYLESLRYLVVIAFIIFEGVTIATVFLAVKTSLNQQLDPDIAISQPIEDKLGKGIMSELLSFEARVWSYALFSNKIQKKHFIGKHHFTCHNKDGAQSNQLGFILLLLVELPFMHLLLHFLWSPLAANITTGLTLLGLMIFIAEYKALAIRPISICDNAIIIRYGVFKPLKIKFTDINSLNTNDKFIARAPQVKRYNLSGNPNIEIKLNSEQLVYLGLDDPHEFMLAFKAYQHNA